MFRDLYNNHERYEETYFSPFKARLGSGLMLSSLVSKHVHGTTAGSQCWKTVFTRACRLCRSSCVGRKPQLLGKSGEYRIAHTCTAIVCANSFAQAACLACRAAITRRALTYLQQHFR